MAAGVTEQGSIILVARVALLNRNMLKHGTILVDSCFNRRLDREALLTRNWPTLKSLAVVRRSVDGGIAGCAEGGYTVLAGVGLHHACGA